VLKDGEPADPPAFNSIVQLREGDTFLAGTALTRFRVLTAVDEPADGFDGILVVELV
jgi:hypothetical protein